MSELDDDTRERYLKEMGITVWSLRDTAQMPEDLPPAKPVVRAVPPEIVTRKNTDGSAVESNRTVRPEKTTAPDLDIPPFLSDFPPPETFFSDVPQPVPFDEEPSAFISPESVPSAETAVEQGPDNWEKILGEIDGCQRCHLYATRNHVVPGIGDRNADWLFVGEGPGFHEDQQGEPFVGRSGKLLDAMMAVMHMKRGENVYIANVVKCRASESGKDRQPTEEEASTCMPYLERQIDLIKPKIMIALGKTAAVALLNTDRDVSLGSLRNREHFFRNGGRKIPLVVTYHPSYLLRTPGGKKQAWQDLCRAMDIYDAEMKREE